MNFQKVCLLAALLALQLPVFAQKFSVGVRAGLGANTVSGSGVGNNAAFYNDPRYLFRPMLGVDARWQFGERLGLLTGLQYAERGYGSTLFWPTGEGDARFVYHSLGLPLMADLRIWKGLSVQAGAEVSKWLSVKIYSSENADISEFYNTDRLNVAGIVGLEYRINRHFFVGLRQVFGPQDDWASDITFTDENGNPTDAPRYTHYSTQLIVGYLFSLRSE